MFYTCTKCLGPHDIKGCTQVKMAVKTWNSNMLSNHSNKERNNAKGGRGYCYKRNAG